LSVVSTLSEPIVELFEAWLSDAKSSNEIEPTAMTLATTERAGRVSARMVLLKGFDARGFVFYTNTESLKGQQIAGHGEVALVFYWKCLERQVRVEGFASAVASAEADAYFSSRGRGSQIGAWASQQSTTLNGGSEELAAAVKYAHQRYHGDAVPRPPHWSGYRVAPNRVEFWQGKPDRLHERFVFEYGGKAWSKRWLYP